MKFLRSFSAAVAFALALGSCTVVTSTNLPGKTADKIPKNMLGKYALEYPGELAAFSDPESPTYITFKTDRVIIENAKGTTETLLGDSLYYTTIGRQGYLSLGQEPVLSVFKVVKSGKDLHLFTMSAAESVTTASLEPHFAKVEEVMGEPNDDGTPGDPSYVVTIEDKKLDGYFKSGIPMTEPFRLKKQ